MLTGKLASTYVVVPYVNSLCNYRIKWGANV